MEGDEAEVSHATNLHPPSTAQAVAVISDSVIDIFDSGGGMGDFQDINGVGTVDRAMANLEENGVDGTGGARVILLLVVARPMYWVTSRRKKH